MNWKIFNLSDDVYDELKPHSFLDIYDLVKIRDAIANIKIDFSVNSGEIEIKVCFPKKRITTFDREEKDRLCSKKSKEELNEYYYCYDDSDSDDDDLIDRYEMALAKEEENEERYEEEMHAFDYDNSEEEDLKIEDNYKSSEEEEEIEDNIDFD